MTWLQLLMYLAYAVFFLGTGYKAWKMATMPLHLRWDLYPIPHEKGKEHYGGSYFEELDWWTKPTSVSMTNEFKEMAREILYIQSMYHNHRSLWYFSFPFHFGLYVSIVFVLLVFLGAILESLGMAVGAEAGYVGQAIHYFTMPIGVIGSALAALGSLGLLLSRVFRADLRRCSNPSDYLNLVLLLGVFVTGLYVWAAQDMGYDQLRAFIASLVTFSPATGVSTAFAVHMVFAAAFLLYLPFTHMTHFVGKYFTYHKVRWEDHPNIKGSKLEKKVAEALGYRINWAAPHIKQNATWAEAATDSGKEADNA